MNEKTEQNKLEVYFSAVLTPHRSLSPKGFIFLMSFIGFVSFSAGVVFYLIGAWPVLGFFGLDVLLVYLAFKLNYRSGRCYETVDLREDVLKLTRVSPSGASQCWSFNPYWVQLDIESEITQATKLFLTSHGKRLVFGQFLSNDEKENFAEALAEALYLYRGRAQP